MIHSTIVTMFGTHKLLFLCYVTPRRSSSRPQSIWGRTVSLTYPMFFDTENVDRKTKEYCTTKVKWKCYFICPALRVSEIEIYIRVSSQASFYISPCFTALSFSLYFTFEVSTLHFFPFQAHDSQFEVSNVRFSQRICCGSASVHLSMISCECVKYVHVRVKLRLCMWLCHALNWLKFIVTAVLNCRICIIDIFDIALHKLTFARQWWKLFFRFCDSVNAHLHNMPSIHSKIKVRFPVSAKGDVR